jgi:hypothetical protein
VFCLKNYQKNVDMILSFESKSWQRYLKPDHEFNFGTYHFNTRPPPPPLLHKAGIKVVDILKNGLPYKIL